MRTFRKLDPWAYPFALMGLIFFLSAQPHLTTGLGIYDLIARKLAHLTEYGLLCFLWWRAMRTRVGPVAAIAAALAISVCYAASDEYHQSFVPGRSAALSDVGIDSAGALCAALWIAARPLRSTQGG